MSKPELFELCMQAKNDRQGFLGDKTKSICGHFVDRGDFCWEGKASFWLPALVAGVGFEPTTFRL